MPQLNLAPTPQRRGRPQPDLRGALALVVDVVEVVCAAVACAVIVSAPLWLAVLAAALFNASFAAPVFFFALCAVVVVPQRRMPERPELDGYQRWGLRMGRLVRAPITFAEARRAQRNTRALSSSTSASSAAAPSLPPPRA